MKIHYLSTSPFLLAAVTTVPVALASSNKKLNNDDSSFPLMTKEIQERILMGAVDKEGNHVFLDDNGNLDLHPRRPRSTIRGTTATSSSTTASRGLGATSKKGTSNVVDGDCAFIFHLNDAFDTTQIQVDNGAILDFVQIINDDDDLIAICDSTKCFGDALELTFIATGECDKKKDVMQFTICEETVLDLVRFKPVFVSCPDITDVASASCTAFDIETGVAVVGASTITAKGSVVKFERGESDACFVCEMECDAPLFD